MQRIALWFTLALTAVACFFTARQAMAAAAEGLLEPGANAPGFTLPSQDDKPVSLKDYRGQWVVLYFYPKDMTSGCTLEAHNFQRDQAKFDALHTAILGVSLDTPDSHKTFCTKENLTFKLLADPNHTVVDEYHVPIKSFGSQQFAARTTYLINPAGKIVKVWPDVKVTDHSEDVLHAIEAAQKS